MEEKQIQNNNISQFNKGLSQDTSLIDSPKGTYRFALNTVNETELGDIGFVSNEESNEICASLTPGYTPIGKCYMGNNTTAIFSVSVDNTISEIGILDDNCNYTVHVNDADSPQKEKLGFKVGNQIQATYRLRRGCERTIYFAGKGYPVRYFNFDKPNQFKNRGLWSSPKFSLYKSLKTFPTLDSVEILDNSGNLVPGSYTVLVQHLDEDLNGSEFYELVKDINIYNDPLNKTFSDIEGSSNIGEDGNPYKYSKTSKAIKIVLDAVDKNFTYVRFAFVERTSGNGQVSSVKYSDPVSVHSPIFTYTGLNASTNGTIEEVELFNANSGIQSAQHIEQIDNMLILANVQGGQEEICKLQKYASRIKTDCFVKDIILTSIKEEHNPKNPLVVHNGLGYQPGDIYSLGIIYVFEDYSVSPVFHIPGKSPSVSKNLIYSPGDKVYPMSNENNHNVSETYLDENTSCPSGDYWGRDSEGVQLKNKNVRHHRFPTRDEINIGFVKRKETVENIAKYKQVSLTTVEVPKKSDSSYHAVNYTIKVSFKRNGANEYFLQNIFPDSNVSIGTMSSNIYLDSDVITDLKLYYIEEGSTTAVEIPLTNNETSVQDNGAKYKITIPEITESNSKHVYEVPILGLKFSDIVLPPEDEIGKKVIGYQIVRQERTDSDKNVLDSAVVFPMMKSGRNVTTAMLAPQFFQSTQGSPATCEGSTDNTYPTCYNISKNNLMLVTPTHRFMDKTHDGFTSIEQVGNFEVEHVGISATSTQNVYEGTSATGDEESSTQDSDGFTLRHGYRFTGVKYTKTPETPLKITNENTRMYNLQGVNYAESEDNTETLYNISFDNKALILSSSKKDIDLRTYRPGKHYFPYVYIKKDNSTFYQGFRSNPYYFTSTEVFSEPTCKVFGGDTYVTPMRYSNHIFGNAVAAIRRKKVSAWAWIGSLFVAALGIVFAVFTGGGSLAIAAGILVALGALVTFSATMIESSKYAEIYGEKWQANLDKTVFDYPYAALFVRQHPYHNQPSYNPDPLYQPWADDTFRWWGEIVGDLWFESTLNISLRVPPMNHENNYLLPLKAYMPDRQFRFYNEIGDTEYLSNQTPWGGQNMRRYLDPEYGPDYPEQWYFLKKITTTENAGSSGLKYTGISIPQIYLINPDHYVTQGIKKFYTIPIEYDCCSECRENFPHRIHYSQQSFQEEKSDNYRMFLPNNYRDIEGETGEITNLYRFYNNLYAHTEEALWQMGRNYQERVTDNIVSFIGTGSYFEIPPQKILDDDTGSSAGTKHKWGSIKTPAGIFFVSENQRKIYQFLGKELKPISNTGLSNWFKNNIEVQLDKEYFKKTGKEYPNRDNPSNLIGTGFISTYDTRKERVIFTKKDLKFKDILFENDSEFCINGNVVTLFNDVTQIVTDYSAQGWTYEGIVDCKLKFSKVTTTTNTETNTVQIWHPPVYETQIDDSVIWINQACVSGSCPNNGPSGSCYDNISITDVDGITHDTTTTNNNGSNFTMCVSVNNFVSTTELLYYGGDSQFYSDTVTYDTDESKIKYVETLIQEGYWETQTVETPVYEQTTEYMFIDGVQHPIEDYIDYDNSWTISYSLKNQTWVSWHSYTPNFYINVPEKFYSWITGKDQIWIHNVIGLYQTFYGKHYPHIVEYVSVSNPLTTRVWNTISLQTESKTFDSVLQEYVDDRYTTFNKAILYNSRQCSGELELVAKDAEHNNEDYLFNQVVNTNVNQSIIDRTERDWFINDFRDIRIDYNRPIWISEISALKNQYFIDKILNTNTLDVNKDWTQLESFRDKYLVVRLIFDKFADKKLITNFSVENEQQSFS